MFEMLNGKHEENEGMKVKQRRKQHFIGFSASLPSCLNCNEKHEENEGMKVKQRGRQHLIRFSTSSSSCFNCN